MGAFVSLHGRAYGFDSETGALIRNGVEGGLGDQTIQAATSATTATALTPRGITTLSSSAAKGYSLTAPIAGLTKVLTATTTSTAIRTITLASGTFGTTAGSSFTAAAFDGEGETLTLTALSTALFRVASNQGGVTFA
jgi:hypothetical protein